MFNDKFLSDRKAALLARMTNHIRQSLDLQEILDATVTELRAFLQTDRTKVYRFDPDGHGQVVAESSAKDRLPSLLGLRYPAEDIPLQARALFVRARTRSIVNVSQQQIILNSLSNPPPTLEALTVEEVLQQPLEEIISRPVDPCHVEYLTQMGVQSSLVVPILHQQELWGLLISHHAEPREVDSEELKIVQILADQVSLAIAHSALLSQAQERSQREAIINQMTALLHLPQRPEEILTTVLEQAIKATSSSGGRLYLTSTDSTMPTYLYTYGKQPDQPELKSSLLENHPIWQAAQKASIVQTDSSSLLNAEATSADLALRVVVDLEQEPRLHKLIEQFTSIRGLMIQPLCYGDQFLGYLTFFRDQIDTESLWAGYEVMDERQQRPRQSMGKWQALKRNQAQPWSLEEVELIQALNVHLSLAIVQDQLYQREQQQRLILEMHNQTLSQARATAEEVSRLKSNFLTSTNHELRTPLASTLNYLKLLKDRLYENEEELREYIEGAHQATESLVTIINNVLDIAKIEEGQMNVEQEIILLPRLLQEQCFLANAQSRLEGISLVLHCEVNQVFADAAKMRQVMNNLLDNAFKFTHQGQVTVRAIADSTGTKAEISVSNTGIGVAADSIERLFNPFVQADGSIQRNYGGTGLGLNICKRLVELMGGQIWLESLGLDQGAIVTFTLPLRQPDTGQLDDSHPDGDQ